MTDAGGADAIELSIPARPVLLQLVRLTAGVVATRADLGLNDVEDLRLAVDELCLSLMGPTGSSGRLHLLYKWDDQMIEISCRLKPMDASSDDPEQEGLDEAEATSAEAEELRQELSMQILDALVDEHGETSNNGDVSAWLRMRRVRSNGE